jgi:hypothetical protein
MGDGRPLMELTHADAHPRRRARHRTRCLRGPHGHGRVARRRAAAARGGTQRDAATSQPSSRTPRAAICT